MAFIAGYSQGATWQATGQGAPTTLNITAWSWEESVAVLDVTHSGTAGQMAVLAGILTGEGTVEANTDAAALPPTLTSPIKAGQKGVIRYSTGSTNPWVIPCMISKVPHKSAVNGLVQYSFTVTFDALSGTYTYPS